jgi:hypothetical protein
LPPSGPEGESDDAVAAVALRLLMSVPGVVGACCIEMGLATETAAFSTAPAAGVACADDTGTDTGLLVVVVGSAADRGTATTSTN